MCCSFSRPLFSLSIRSSSFIYHQKCCSIFSSLLSVRFDLSCFLPFRQIAKNEDACSNGSSNNDSSNSSNSLVGAIFPFLSLFLLLYVENETKNENRRQKKG